MKQSHHYSDKLLAAMLSVCASCLLSSCTSNGDDQASDKSGRGSSGGTATSGTPNSSGAGGENKISSANKSGTDSKSGKTEGATAAAGDHTEDARSQKPVKVQTIIVGLHDIAPELVLTGVVGALPDHLVKVTPAVAGKLKKVFVIEGQKVKRGDLIAILDTAHLADQLKQADANVRAAEGTVKQAQEAASFATDNLERQKNLFQAEVSAKKDISAAQNQLQSAQLQIQTAQAQLEAAKASRAQIQTEVDLTTIRAPISGVISSRYLNSNDTADLNAAIVQIVALDSVLISAALPADSPEMPSLGQHAKVTSEANAKNSFDAKITAISPMVDRASNTVATQLLCPNLGGKLRDGENVKVAIATKHIGQAIVIPQTALVPDPNSASDEMVYVVTGNQAKRVAVKSGVAQNGQVQILKGLSPGQKIIVKGAYGLPDDSLVEAESEPSK
jgi:cobalt-zinc-cadmium efflux system membrane fusion protein